ncbi:MAG TPA: beta-ketoacyl-[acyl-carrier-protein] synthase family protein, partial [Candidatus Omnitrophota bacterium]|nr:beta-ketoacyl-[acyl-carrier-protein] synthase family protein [Candidatus Omnitrophota bacterium]
GLNGVWRPIGAAVKDFSPEKYITQRKALKVMARDIQLAVAAARLAFDDAQMKSNAYLRDRFGVIIGSGVLNHELEELSYSVQSSLGEDGKLDIKRFGEDGLPALFPLWLLKYLPNMPACHVSILFDLQGPNNTLTTGPSAGLQAVGEAFRIIQRGAADLMLAGGGESKLNPVGLSQYRVQGVLANEGITDPKKACQPFSQNASGIVVGEGAAFLILEEFEHAKHRGAKIYAEIVGFGSSSPKGRSVAMRAALNEAGIEASKIGLLQACGLSYPKEDVLEIEAMNDIFTGACKDLTVSCSKPLIGFTGFSAGAIDLVLSALALKNQTVPTSVNFERPQSGFGFKVAQGQSEEKHIDYAMTNTFGLNGQSASMILKHTGERVS